MGSQLASRRLVPLALTAAALPSRRLALGLLALTAAALLGGSGAKAAHPERTTYRLVIMEEQVSDSDLAGLKAQLNSEAGPRLDPPATFDVNRTLSLDLDQHHVQQWDFLSLPPIAAACIEAQYRFAPLLTYRRVPPGETEGTSEMGGAVVALKTSRITSLKALQDAVVASPTMSLVHQHASALEEQNVSLVMAAKQLRVFEDHDRVFADVLAGTADAALVYSAMFEALDASKREKLQVIGAAERMMSNEEPYPLQSTSRLFPENVIMAGPHVPWQVQREVTIALLRLNLTETRGAAGPRLAFQPALSYADPREVIKSAGLQQPEGGRYTCGFMHRGDRHLYDAFSCPPGSYKISPEKFMDGCLSEKLACPDGAEAQIPKVSKCALQCRSAVHVRGR